MHTHTGGDLNVCSGAVQTPAHREGGSDHEGASKTKTMEESGQLEPVYAVNVFIHEKR